MGMADAGATEPSERNKDKSTDGEARVLIGITLYCAVFVFAVLSRNYSAGGAGGEFLMIDYEEQLAHELEDARNELYKQITSVVTKLNLLWEVVRSMIVFTIPIIAGIGLSFLSQCYLPRTVAAVFSITCNGITFGLVFLNLSPLNEAISNYSDSRVYTPKFVNCKCKICHDRNNCSEEQHAPKHVGTATDIDTTSEHQDVSSESSATSVDTVISNTAGNPAGDTDKTLRRRFASIEPLNQYENSSDSKSKEQECK